jgi:protein-tyrosine phosphatase
VFSWFRKSSATNRLATLEVDIHSHLLPAIDDGVKDVTEAIGLISRFRELGYKKLITTPHIISDLYKNTPEIIDERLQIVRAALAEAKIDITLEAAAEYYLDESLLHSIKNNERLLTVANRYLLFETNFLMEPLLLKEFIFQASSKGYKVILAHPERYLYLHDHYEKIEDLLSRGVLLQLNLTSLTGHYSRPAQKLAMQLIDNKHVHFLGSDCHNQNHMDLIHKVQRHRYFEKALTLPLLNNTLK